MTKKRKTPPLTAIPEEFGQFAPYAVQKGQLVRSIAGRDKGEYYLVIGCAINTLYLANGRGRKVINPKKKNIRHVQRCNRIAADMVAATQGRLFRDEEIRAGICKLLADD